MLDAAPRNATGHPPGHVPALRDAVQRDVGAVVQLHLERAFAPLSDLSGLFLRGAAVVQDGVLGPRAGRSLEEAPRNAARRGGVALRNFGADDYLIKPIQSKVLAEVLARFL